MSWNSEAIKKEENRKRTTVVSKVIGIDFYRNWAAFTAVPFDGVINTYEDGHKELHTYLGNKTLIKQL